MNEKSAFEIIKLKGKESFVSISKKKKDSVVHIKLDEHGKGIKILYKSHFSNHILRLFSVLLTYQCFELWSR